MGYEKIDREFCLTDDSVNVYGYRCLTSGLELEKFNPPIGFLMHNREGGVAVRWEDFRISEGKLYAKPLVNTTRYPDLAEEISAGFYSGASIGKIVALEMSDDSKYKLEGQTGVTVTRWFPRECSIVDIPGNYSALAQLYDNDDNLLLDLSDNLNIDLNMDRTNLTASDMKLLDLADSASAAQVSAALQNLYDKATRCDVAEKGLNDLKAEVEEGKIASILKGGIASKKLTKELSDKLKVDYAGRSAELQALVDALPAQMSVMAQLNDDVPEKYKGKSLNDLYLSGDLADVKKNYPELYKELAMGKK